jgi:hypothetical protein
LEQFQDDGGSESYGAALDKTNDEVGEQATCVQVESDKATIIIVAATIPIQPLWEDVGVVPPESRTITIEPLEEDVGRKV